MAVPDNTPGNAANELIGIYRQRCRDTPPGRDMPQTIELPQSDWDRLLKGLPPGWRLQKRDFGEPHFFFHGVVWTPKPDVKP